jgi:hypothetical protein
LGVRRRRGGWGSHEGWRVRRPQESKKDQRSLEGRRRRRRAVELGIELERALDQVDLYSKGWGGSGGWGGLGWVGVSLGEGYVDFDQEWRWGIDFNQVVLVRRPRPGMERVRRPQSGGDEDIDLKVKGLEVELSWVEVGLEMDLKQTSIKGRLGYIDLDQVVLGASISIKCGDGYVDLDQVVLGTSTLRSKVLRLS